MVAPVLALADDFWMSAHDRELGRSHLPPRVLGIGLAAALLGELALNQSISVQEEHLYVYPQHNQYPTDAATGVVLNLLVQENAAGSGRHGSKAQPVTAWIEHLQSGLAQQLVEERLSATPLVQRQVQKRMLRAEKVTYVPADTIVSGSPSARIKDRVRRGAWLHAGDKNLEQDLALAGITIATGMDRATLESLNNTERMELGRLIQANVRPDVLELITCAEAAVTRLTMTR